MSTSPAADWLVNNPDTGEEVAAPATGFSLGGSGTSASADVGTFNAPSVSGVAAAATHDATAPIDAETATDPGANSLKCDDCGRMLRDTTAAQAHATRTGHQNFSQSTEVIKPLSGRHSFYA